MMGVLLLLLIGLRRRLLLRFYLEEIFTFYLNICNDLEYMRNVLCYAQAIVHIRDSCNGSWFMVYMQSIGPLDHRSC